jgi:hypothetical protein
MTNAELIAIIEEHNPTTKWISEQLEVPIYTVNNWRRSVEPSASRKMPRSARKLLRMVVADKQD